MREADKADTPDTNDSNDNEQQISTTPVADTEEVTKTDTETIE